MLRVFAMCCDAAIAAILIVPFYCILNKRCFHNRLRTTCFILMALYMCSMFSVAGLPDIRYVRFDPNHNIVPFAYMFSDYKNSLLNIVLFIPLGFLLPVLWVHFQKLFPTVFFGFFTSTFIESLQIFTHRASDINDLMTNTVGTLVGWCLARLLLHLTTWDFSGIHTKEVGIVCGSSFFVMFFLHPYLAELFLFLL